MGMKVKNDEGVESQQMVTESHVTRDNYNSSPMKTKTSCTALEASLLEGHIIRTCILTR